MSKILKLLLPAVFVLVAGRVFGGQDIVPVTLNAQATPEPGKVVMITVYMTAQTAVANGSLEIYPPEGVKIYEGQSRWSGDLAKGHTVKLVNWYDLAELKEANAAAWKVFTRGNMNGLLRARMQQVKLSPSQVSEVFGTADVVSRSQY